MGPATEGPGRGTIGTIRVVTSFYTQVLGSPLLYQYFAGVPIEVLIAKQAAFIDTVVRGEPRLLDHRAATTARPPQHR